MKKNLLGMGVLLCCAAGAQAAQVQDARVVSETDNVSLVLDLDESVEVKHFTLSAPDRVVVDLLASKGSNALDKLEFPNNGPVRRLRQGNPNAHDLRLVLELDKPAKPKIVLAKDKSGPRLTVSIPSDASTPPAKPVALTTVTPKKAEVDEPKPVRQAKASGRGRDIVIAVDAGHGGHDSGATGPTGIKEKDVVLEVARRLAAELNKQRGIRAVLTRSDDYFIPLRDRTRIARDNHVDMFVSVHADAYRDQRASGSSVFVLSERGATSEMARWLAASENSVEMRNGASLDGKDGALKSVLLDLSQSGTIAESLDAAERVMTRLDRIGNLHRGFVEQAGFVVLKSLDIPSMLVETAFISNPTEEQKLNSADYQQRLAEAITEGVRDYFVAKPIPGTTLAMRDNGRDDTKLDQQHVIAVGETLSVIAQRYRVSMDRLKSLNDITDDNMIVVGKVLRIPSDS